MQSKSRKLHMLRRLKQTNSVIHRRVYNWQAWELHLSSILNDCLTRKKKETRRWRRRIQAAARGRRR